MSKEKSNFEKSLTKKIKEWKNQNSTPRDIIGYLEIELTKTSLIINQNIIEKKIIEQYKKEEELEKLHSMEMQSNS